MWSVENAERDNWRNKSLQNGKLNNDVSPLFFDKDQTYTW